MTGGAQTKCILVLGMHRSGTSALTGAIHRLGVPLGSELLEPSFDNKDGFFEHKCIVNLNDRLLAFFGGSWLSVPLLPSDWWLLPELEVFRNEALALLQLDFAQEKLFAIKDPRLCVLLPFWRWILEKAHIDAMAIHMLRSPEEVVDSLFRRDGMARETALRLWVRYVADAERFGAGVIRTRCHFDELLRDRAGTLNRIGDELGIAWPVAPESIAGDLDQFLSPNKRKGIHQSAGDLPEDVAVLYQSILANAPSLPPSVPVTTGGPLTGQGKSAHLFPRAAATAVASASGVALSAYVRNLATREIEVEDLARNLHRGLAEARADAPAQEVSGMQHLWATAYWRHGTEGFAENRSSHQYIHLRPETGSTSLVFDIDAEELSAIRFDPLTRPGILFLASAELVSASGDELWQWDGRPESFAGSQQALLVHDQGSPGVAIVATGVDPYVEVVFPQTYSEQGFRFRVRIGSDPALIQETVNRWLGQLDGRSQNPLAAAIRDHQEALGEQIAAFQQDVCGVLRAREDELDLTRTKVQVLEQDLKKAVTEQLRVERELGNMLAGVREKDCEIKKIRADLETRSEELETVRNELSRRANELWETQREFAAMEGKLHAREDDLESTREALDSLRGDFLLVKNELAKTTSRLDAREEDLDATHRDLNVRDGRIIELAQSLAERERTIVSHCESLASRDSEISSLKQSITEHAAAIRKIEESLVWRMAKPFRIALEKLNKGNPRSRTRV